MSAGRFNKFRYETDGGQSVIVRCQPETAQAVFNPGGTNAQSPDAVTADGRFSVNLNNRRKNPFSARYVRFRFTGEVPDGYAEGQEYKIPIFQGSVYDAITEQSTGTYLGKPIQVLSKVRQEGNF